MSVLSNLRLAEYFEGRAKRGRRDRLERERFLAIARGYRAQAEAERDRSGRPDSSARRSGAAPQGTRIP
jgi:hypothetical protein